VIQFEQLHEINNGGYLKRRYPILKLVILLWVISPVLVYTQEPIMRIRVSGMIPHQDGIPISVSLDRLPESLRLISLQWVDVHDSRSLPIPFQIDHEEPPRLWWILKRNESGGSERTYELQTGKQVTGPHVEINIDGEGLEMSFRGSGALRYNFAPVSPPEGENPLYTRSGFIHPIWTPEGKVLTRIHPSDHIHHLGFWNPWTKTEFEGRPVDFWNLKEGQGTVRFVRFTRIESGPIFAGFEAIQEHVDFTAPQGEKIALNELWKVRFWNLNEGDPKLWTWDFTTVQACASDQALLLLKYRYGGFGFRGTSEWNKNNSDFLTSEGKTRVDGNGSRARWCRMSGHTDQGPAGVVFLSHPENHEHPEPMRIWPDGDIFFGFCPVVDADSKLIPGETYVRKYRVLAYDGTLGAEEIDAYWSAFAHPPNVEIKWSQN